MPTSTDTHYVPEHITRDGTYIPPHYEPKKKPKFAGYFSKEDTPGSDGRRGYLLPGDASKKPKTLEEQQAEDAAAAANNPYKPIEGRVPK